MIEAFDDLQRIALTALFNPTFLVLLLILFFAGKFFGKLTKNMNIWKILALGYCSIFLFPAVRDAGLILGGLFVLGMLSNHTSLIISVFSWAGSLGDVIYGFRYRSAFEEIRRREQELDKRETRLREEERRRAYKQQERGKGARSNWQRDAKSFRNKDQTKKDQQASQRRNTSDKHSRGYYKDTNKSGEASYKSHPVENKRMCCLKILGLDPSKNYSSAELKAAYRKKVKKAHPDAGGSQEDFIEVVNAYEWFYNFCVEK